MKNSNETRSEHARNEMRDSQGHFESKDQKNGSHSSQSSHSSGNHTTQRGENTKHETRDSDGHFTSKK